MVAEKSLKSPPSIDSFESTPRMPTRFGGHHGVPPATDAESPVSVASAPFRASTPMAVVAPGAGIPTSTETTWALTAPSSVTAAVVSAGYRAIAKPSRIVALWTAGPKYTPAPVVGARVVPPCAQRDHPLDS